MLSGGLGGGGRRQARHSAGRHHTCRVARLLYFYEDGGVATGPQMAIFSEGGRTKLMCFRLTAVRPGQPEGGGQGRRSAIRSPSA